MEQNEILKNISIQRCAEIVYYNLYGESRHPRYGDYDDIDDFIDTEFPELESGKISSIDQLFYALCDKMEKQKHSKSVILRSILNFVSSPYFKERDGLPDEISDWMEDSIKRLMQNENDKLDMFPIHIWYNVNGQYAIRYKPHIHGFGYSNQLRGRNYQRRTYQYYP